MYKRDIKNKNYLELEKTKKKRKKTKKIMLDNICTPPSLSKLTLIISNIELTHLGS